MSTEEQLLKITELDTKVEPVRLGRWKWEKGYVGTLAVCSVCGLSPIGFYSLPKNQIGRLPIYEYCPRCGARMDLSTPTEVQLDETGSVMFGGADNG